MFMIHPRHLIGSCVVVCVCVLFVIFVFRSGTCMNDKLTRTHNMPCTHICNTAHSQQEKAKNGGLGAGLKKSGKK